MSRKDYVEIAKIINDSTSLYDDNICLKKVLIDDLSEYFTKDNRAFDKTKFSEACNFTLLQ